MTTASPRMGAPDQGAALLELVEELATELEPGLRAGSVTLDSVLDRDLALDSLSRVELLTRLERRFEVGLAEQAVALAETPRDLLRIVEHARRARPGPGAEAAAPVAAAPELERGESTPERATTLLEVLDWHVAAHAERRHILLYDEEDRLQEIRYGDLLRAAEQVAAGLRERGLGAAETVAIMLPTSAEYFYSFYGTLLAGGIPVPLYPPVRPSQLEDHLRRQALILRNCCSSLLITVPEAKPLARLLRSQVETLDAVCTVEELRAADSKPLRPRVRPEDIAFLQYTSGSTGQPKGVVLTHQNLLANLRAMGRTVEVGSADTFVSWLPLYHDMGLIGAGMGSLLFAFPLVLMSPLAFLSRPQRWLWTIHRHRGTISAGPNFAYELCLAKIPEAELEGLDLSSWRLALNGAEPVGPDTLSRFHQRFAPYGLREEALIPVYGLAESSLGAAFPPLGRGPMVDRVDRRSFVRSGRAEAARADDREALRFVACGFPLPGHQLRIADPRGSELPERHQGRVQFRGPSSTQGYYRNAEATRELMCGEWLDSGDLGYMAAGELFLTGRAKDIIIRAGRNLSPYELESAVGQIEGIRTGCVAVFGVTDQAAGTERLVVLAETREADSERREKLRREVVATVTDVASLPPDEVVLGSPGSVLKTSSGKIRRSACRELYEHGRLGGGRPAVWRQLLSLALASVLPESRRLLRSLGGLLYALYAAKLSALVVFTTGFLVLVVPGAERRQRLTGGAARTLLRLAGIRLRVDGREHLPRGEAYVVATNHASYSDAVIVAAALLPGVSIVAKSELGENRLVGLLLRRIGVDLVERFDRERSLEDSRRLLARLRASISLVFFPEGTFTRIPGLLPFRMGTFLTAAEAGAPVVPMVIRGSRSLLRAGEWRIRRGAVVVTLLPPVPPSGSDWAAAVELRDRTRAAILERLGEPDLVHEREEGLERLRRERLEETG